MPTAKYRSHKHFRLSVADAKAAPVIEDRPWLPWPVAAVGGGLAAVLAGTLVLGAVALTIWIGAPALPFTEVLSVIGRLWLLAHGGGWTAPGIAITVVPLGITAVMVAFSFSLSAFALTQGVLARAEALSAGALRRLVLLTSLQFVIGYGAGAVLIALLLGDGLGPAMIGAVAVAAVGSLAGAGWSAGYRLAGPAWLRGAVAGAGVALLGLVILAATALIVAVVQGEVRISALEASLGLDTSGAVVWAFTCLAYLPTLLGWTASWLLGAGFSVGEGSMVAPWVTQLGLLPSVPVFGALPPAGVAHLEPWLASGLIVGALAAVVAVRTAGGGIAGAIGSGALAGGLAGGVFLGWAWLSRGGLGVDRFAMVGPLWPEMLIGLGILVGAATLAAVITWFVSARGASDS